jgi:hypothetical protein
MEARHPRAAARDRIADDPMTVHSAALPAGVLIPESVLHHHEFAILAAFVAVNTVMYVALAVAKMLPKVYLGDLLHRGQRRAETRSIHPDD